MGRPKIPIEERLWSKVDKRGPDECWPFIGKTRCGSNLEYGEIWLNGKNALVHRVAWEITNGPVPEGLVVRHLCNNPICANPSHLAVGTQKDNIADRERAGRGNPPRGESHPHSRYSDEIIQAVREATGSQYEIARRFGMSRSYVSAIRLGTWRKVADAVAT